MNNIIYYLKLSRLTGVFGAIRFFFDKKKKNKIIRVNIKGLNHPVFLRTNSSDIYSFSDLIVGTHNHLLNLKIENIQIIVDAGANIGLTTVQYASMFPMAKIFAIEPESGNFEMLKKNTGAYPNITILQNALWYNHDKLKIENPDAASWAFHFGKADSGNGVVDAITIDDLFTISGSHQIDYLKIDVEGAEKEIFEHIELSTLQKIRYIGIELHDRINSGCSESFYKKISRLHFSVIRNLSGDHIIRISENT